MKVLLMVKRRLVMYHNAVRVNVMLVYSWDETFQSLARDAIARMSAAFSSRNLSRSMVISRCCWTSWASSAIILWSWSSRRAISLLFSSCVRSIIWSVAIIWIAKNKRRRRVNMYIHFKKLPSLPLVHCPQ